jgi:hypothetical protein
VSPNKGLPQSFFAMARSVRGHVPRHGENIALLALARRAGKPVRWASLSFQHLVSIEV